MKTTYKFLLFTIVLLLVGLGTISAADAVSDTSNATDIGLDEISETNQIEDATLESSIQSTDVKTIEKNDITKNKAVKSAPTMTVTSSNFDNFWQFNEDEGIYRSTEFIKDGDVLNLKGTFNDVNFTLDKSVTLTSTNENALLHNCTVHVLTSGSGSTISNLVINNSAQYTSGIVANDAENLTVENNVIEVCGLHSYGFEANLNHSVIRSNYIETHRLTPDTERTHTALVICDSFYNTIDNNTVISDYANCIYLSIYPGVDIRGGPSDYNNVTNNHAEGANTAWSYTIQIMGSYNNIENNSVVGGFRGVSTAGTGNYIYNNDVDAENIGIDATDNSIVIDNYVHVSNVSIGVVVEGNNVLVANNTIITQNESGIDIQSIDGNNVTITGNEITANGYGIYSKGKYSQIVIENNKITSTKEGILFKYQSRQKKMNHILVTKNNIKSDADYAINLEQAGSSTAAQVNVTVTQSNVLSSKNGIGLSLTYLPPSNSNSTVLADTNQVIRVNSKNYTDWFENGRAKDTVLQNATVYLSGTFNNVDFTFTKKAHIIGENCLINNGTIILTEDAHASTITDITINNKFKTDYNVHGIEVFEVNNCKITNINITNYGRFESIGILLHTSNGDVITDCNINTSGDYVNNAVFLYASDSNTLENIHINLNQSNVKYEYAPSIMFNEKIGSIKEILHNHGILLVYSSDNTINKNDIKVTSMFKEYEFPVKECQNSIVGLDIYFDSHKNTVTNNNISVDSYGPFSYGMGVLGGQWGTEISASNAKNNVYKNNNVTVKGGYFATGFIAGRNSVNTQIDSNVFTVIARKNATESGDYALGITLENSTQSKVKNNKLTVTGSAVYGMELFDSGSNVIFNNSIYSTGTNPYSIAGYAASKNNITNNTLIAKKVINGSSTSAEHADAIHPGDQAIMFMAISKNNNIKYNKINTTANITVKFTDDTSNNTVQENSLVSKISYGDQSTLDEANANTISNNFIHFVNATVNHVEIYAGDYITLVANVNASTKDCSNLTVEFSINNVKVGTSKVENGKATFTYTNTLLLSPGELTTEAFVSGTNFQNVTALSTVLVRRSAETTNVEVDKVLAKVGSTAVLTANIKTAKGFNVDSGKAEFYVDGTLVDTVNVASGLAKCNYTIDNAASNELHNITVKYTGNEDYADSTGSNILGVQSKTTITVNNHTATLGENVNIAANIVSGSEALKSGSAKVYVNNVLLTTVTISNGNINKAVKVPTTFDKGTYDLKVVFDGNDTVAGATATAKITLNPMTPVLHYNTTWVDVGENSSLVLVVDNGATGSDLCLADGGNVSIKLNGQYLKDSEGNVIYGVLNNGKLTLTFTAPSQLSGSQNITFDFGGNSKFSSASETFANGLMVGRINTVVTMDKIANVGVNDNVTLTGRFTEETGKAISNSNVRIFINDVKYLARTDKDGYYNLSVQVTTPGVNNVTYGYGGNNKYNAYEATTTFNVGKQDVIVTYDKIKEVPAGTNVTITGKFTNSDGKAISNSNVRIFINGVKYFAKTDSKGVYNLSALVTKVGVNNLTVGYAGSAKYNEYNVDTTFNVGKQNVIVTVNKINEVKAGTNVTITGKFTDNLGKAISNSNVRLFVNGVKYFARTDKTGAYNLSVLVTKVGVNNLTYGYAGSAKYNEYNKNTTFNVGKQDVIVTVDEISKVNAGNNVTIKGTFTDNLGKALSNSNVRLYVNGVKYYAKTDKTGTYTLSVLVTNVGVNNLTVGYGGNTKYNEYNVNTTFDVGKQDVIVTYNKISDVKVGKNVTITGKFTNNLGKAISNSNVKVVINGVKYVARTDSTGTYTLTYTTTKVGVNNVTVGYSGSAKYNAYETSTTFKVTS